MSSKVVPIDGTHGNSHPNLYEGNHWDYYFSLLPIFMPLPLFTVPNAYFLRDPILSFKAHYSLLKVYKTLESTHF